MRKPLLTAALCAALFTAALFLFEFHISISSTAQEIAVTRISGGNGTELQPNPLSPQVSPLGIYTQDPKLSEYLSRKVKELPGFDQVEILEAYPQDQTNPVLVVNLTESKPLWLAFFAKSASSATMIFASDGQWNGDHIAVNDGQPPVVHLKTEIQISDRTAGIISLPWYLRRLRESIGDQVIQSLNDDLLQRRYLTVEN